MTTDPPSPRSSLLALSLNSQSQVVMFPNVIVNFFREIALQVYKVNLTCNTFPIQFDHFLFGAVCHLVYPVTV